MIEPTSAPRRTRIVLALILLAALAVRANFVLPIYWQEPYDVHSLDEHFLPLEALALWEGVTPRELGWPGSTMRLLRPPEKLARIPYWAFHTLGLERRRADTIRRAAAVAPRLPSLWARVLINSPHNAFRGEEPVLR